MGWNLQSTSSLQQPLQLRTLLALQVRVTTNVLLANEDVGDGALVGDFLEGVLEVGSVGCTQHTYISTQVS